MYIRPRVIYSPACSFVICKLDLIINIAETTLKMLQSMIRI
jgi:hypothetical protein